MQEKKDIFIDLNEIINNTIEGILIIQNGFIRNINQSLLDILGYENKNDLIGNLATGILIPTSQEKFIKYNSKIFQEISIITKNGDIIPVIIKIKDMTFSNEEYKLVYILVLAPETFVQLAGVNPYSQPKSIRTLSRRNFVQNGL